jgi:hypothetical protein
MTGGLVIVGSRRVAAITAVLGLFAVGAFCVHLVLTTEVFAKTEFSGAGFRAAVHAHDTGAMQDQAHAAVESAALIGLSPKRLERTLGTPSRIQGHGRTYIWELGEAHAFFFPAMVTLYVEFDAKGRRVETAEVSQPDD